MGGGKFATFFVSGKLPNCEVSWIDDQKMSDVRACVYYDYVYIRLGKTGQT